MMSKDKDEKINITLSEQEKKAIATMYSIAIGIQYSLEVAGDIKDNMIKDGGGIEFFNDFCAGYCMAITRLPSLKNFDLFMDRLKALRIKYMDEKEGKKDED